MSLRRECLGLTGDASWLRFTVFAANHQFTFDGVFLRSVQAGVGNDVIDRAALSTDGLVILGLAVSKGLQAWSNLLKVRGLTKGRTQQVLVGLPFSRNNRLVRFVDIQDDIARSLDQARTILNLPAHQSDVSSILCLVEVSNLPLPRVLRVSEVPDRLLGNHVDFPILQTIVVTDTIRVVNDVDHWAVNGPVQRTVCIPMKVAICLLTSKHRQLVRVMPAFIEQTTRRWQALGLIEAERNGRAVKGFPLIVVLNHDRLGERPGVSSAKVLRLHVRRVLIVIPTFKRIRRTRGDDGASDGQHCSHQNRRNSLPPGLCPGCPVGV